MGELSGQQNLSSGFGWLCLLLKTGGCGNGGCAAQQIVSTGKVIVSVHVKAKPWKCSRVRVGIENT